MTFAAADLDKVRLDPASVFHAPEDVLAAAGLSVEEAADALGISRTTASRYWTYARVWLFSELNDDEE